MAIVVGDVGADGVGARVLEIDDGAPDGCAVLVDDFAFSDALRRGAFFCASALSGAASSERAGGKREEGKNRLRRGVELFILFIHGQSVVFIIVAFLIDWS